MGSNEGEAACWERRSLAPAAHSGTCFCVWLFVRKLLPCPFSLSGLAALAVCPMLALLVTSKVDLSTLRVFALPRGTGAGAGSGLADHRPWHS